MALLQESEKLNQKEKTLLRRGAEFMRMKTLGELIAMYLMTPERMRDTYFWESANSDATKLDVLGLVGIDQSIPLERYDKLMAKFGEITGVGVSFNHQELILVYDRGFGKYRHIQGKMHRVVEYLKDISK